MAICEVGVCDGSGWIEVDEMSARPCACREIKAKRKQSRRLGTGIPKRFRGVGFDRKPIVDMDPRLITEVRRVYDLYAIERLMPDLLLET